MITVTLAQLKADITPKLRGTSLRQIKDFYGKAGSAASRMLGRIDPEETRRTVTMATPFFDNVNDYALVTDYKRMLDIRPQQNINRGNMPGLSDFSQTTPKQFNISQSANSYSIKFNNMVRSLRLQQMPTGNVSVMDSFDGPTSNGSWSTSGDASGLYTEALNYVEGNGALGFNISGSTGTSTLVNSTAAVTDLSAFRYEDYSFLFVWMPIGFSQYFTSVEVVRGSSAGNYITATATSKQDGTAFNDGWNFIGFSWATGVKTGTPDDTKNTYRNVIFTTTVGQAITGVLVDNWTDSLGTLYEVEYYSEYMFRSSSGAWKAVPTSDTDLVNVSIISYEILKTEMMVDITQDIRTGATKEAELTDWRLMLNGQPQSRYVKDPPYHGLYADYLAKYPSSAIATVTETYCFDL